MGRIPPVAILAHNRATELAMGLDSLVQAQGFNETNVHVYHDCEHKVVRTLVLHSRSLHPNIHYHPHDNVTSVLEDLDKFRGGKLAQLRAIGAHYEFVLEDMFSVQYPNEDAIIILEDDLLVSPDFFSYFAATRTLLSIDSSLFCISAFNDNAFVELAGRGSHVQRTEYFPGLGWMLTRGFYEEIRGRLGESLSWDYVLRSSGVTKGRECLYPEVPRTRHIGMNGVNSHLLPYEKWSSTVRWGDDQNRVSMNLPINLQMLPGLVRPKYEEDMRRRLFKGSVVLKGWFELERALKKKGRAVGAAAEKDFDMDDLIRKGAHMEEFLIFYNSSSSPQLPFSSSFYPFHEFFGLFPNWLFSATESTSTGRGSVPRTSHQGVVPFFYRGKRFLLVDVYSQYVRPWFNNLSNIDSAADSTIADDCNPNSSNRAMGSTPALPGSLSTLSGDDLYVFSEKDFEKQGTSSWHISGGRTFPKGTRVRIAPLGTSCRRFCSSKGMVCRAIASVDMQRLQECPFAYSVSSCSSCAAPPPHLVHLAPYVSDQGACYVAEAPVLTTSCDGSASDMYRICPCAVPDEEGVKAKGQLAAAKEDMDLARVAPLIAAHLQRNQVATAIGILEGVQAVYSTFAEDIGVAFARLFLNVKMNDEARAVLSKIDQPSLQVQSYIGHVMDLLGRSYEAAEMKEIQLELLLAEYERNAVPAAVIENAFNDLGIKYTVLGNGERALQIFERGIETFPASRLLRTNFARASLKIDGSSLSTYQRVIALLDYDPGLHTYEMLAEVSSNLAPGNSSLYHDVRRYSALCLKVDPENNQCRNHYAFASCYCHKDIDGNYIPWFCLTWPEPLFEANYIEICIMNYFFS